ncbi:Dynein heavy chain 9, axonemal [Tupaia chinensis]|uniref:Dynein heavy chain 9, axonemal n=1 Tax=Tupaia chinensis TaxID=246437 RepID=L9KXP0_TUPCH|nr:Dynein heavy chain 9, axonemal [Tupaia chinensis]
MMILCNGPNIDLSSGTYKCKAGITPIFEAQLSLAIPELIFYPSLESGVKGGFYDIIEGLVNSIFRISSLVPRLSPWNGSPHYQVDLEGMAHLASMRATLLERVQSTMALCCSYRNTFSPYSYLYVEDRKEILGQFLLYGHVLTPEEMEALVDDGIPENPPLLHQFKVQIDSYETLYGERFVTLNLVGELQYSIQQSDDTKLTPLLNSELVLLNAAAALLCDLGLWTGKK